MRDKLVDGDKLVDVLLQMFLERTCSGRRDGASVVV